MGAKPRERNRLERRVREEMPSVQGTSSQDEKRNGTETTQNNGTETTQHVTRHVTYEIFLRDEFRRLAVFLVICIFREFL